MNELGQEYVAIAILAAGLGTIALLALLIFCTQRVHRTIRQARRDGGNFPVFVVPFSPATAYQLHFRSPDDDDGTPASLPASARAVLSKTNYYYCELRTTQILRIITIYYYYYYCTNTKLLGSSNLARVLECVKTLVVPD